MGHGNVRKTVANKVSGNNGRRIVAASRFNHRCGERAITNTKVDNELVELRRKGDNIKDKIAIEIGDLKSQLIAQAWLHCARGKRSQCLCDGEISVAIVESDIETVRSLEDQVRSTVSIDQRKLDSM